MLESLHLATTLVERYIATGNRITDRKFKPNMREDNQIWAEVELPADVDYQSIFSARKKARIKKDAEQCKELQIVQIDNTIRRIL